MLIGIDYGSKLSGLTAMAILDQGEIKVLQSKKNSDADRFILEHLAPGKPELLCVDAPLSLPSVYTNPAGGADYFYRQCDRELHAMSPMFLGGLTARAIKLKNQIETLGTKVWETYPSAIAIMYNMHGYKKTTESIPTCLEFLFDIAPELKTTFPIENWHAFDALLCLWTAINISKQTAASYGDPNEGLIYVPERRRR